MADIALPDLSLLWASAGDILQPSDSKIQQGWAPEIPPRQWFNWLDNRQDEAIAHIAQHGISVWSSTLEYQAGKSYVQGSDGVIYKAITTNTNVNPVGGAVGNWQTAFANASDFYTKSEVDSKTTIASTSQAQTQTNNTALLTPLRLSEAFKGSNQQLSSTGFQKIPGGLIIQWGAGTVNNSNGGATVTLPVTFPTATVLGLAIAQLDNSAMSQSNGLSSTSSIVFEGTVANIGGTSISNVPNGTVFRWLALGY